MYEDVEREREKILDNESYLSREKEEKRPAVLTVLCVLTAVGSITALLSLKTSITDGMVDWFPNYLRIVHTASLIGVIGLWLMKRWGLFLFFGVSLINQIVTAVYVAWSPLMLIYPAVLIIVGFKYLKKLT